MKNKKVRTWVRVRPTSQFAHDMVDLQRDGKTINIHQRRDSRRGVVNNQILDWSFKLDGIFHNASQEQVYDTVADDIVKGALQGYNGTLMCYGQTGAGKTFTMTGATENYKHRGLIPRAIQHVFREIEDRAEQAISIRISYLEIYNETMFDLLTTLPDTLSQAQVNPMTVVEDHNGCYVKGLSCHLAQNEEEALNLLFEGETNRAIAAHSLNKHSSRSHCIFTVYIESRSRVSSDAKYTLSKLNFVDLAGSERLSKTQSTGTTQQEAMYINKSLTFLEQTVIALGDRRRDHVPFRQTKLTHCLKDSIGGNCNTLLIANIWGEAAQLEETVSTMRFATRMMSVAIEPAVNEHYDPAVNTVKILVKRLEREMASLKQELAMHDTLNNRSQISYDPLSEQQRYEIKQQVRAYTEANLDEIDIVNIRQIQGVFESFRELCSEMRSDIESEFRQRYTMIDKKDPAAIAAAQEEGLPIDDQGELVGDSDGSSFGVGKAPSSAKAGHSAVVNARKKEIKRGKSKDRDKLDRSSLQALSDGSPAPKAVSPGGQSSRVGGDTKSETSGKDDKERDAMTPSSMIADDKKPQRPSTPPSRNEEFEKFKKERGSEINRILLENKEILGGKKKSYADLAHQINQTKVDIDGCRETLEQLQTDRQTDGQMYNEEGDTIISEQEYLHIKKLKQLKEEYKANFEELRNLKSEVQYCQKLVDQCRQKLIQEFDNYYNTEFLSGADGEVANSQEAGHGMRAGTQAQYRAALEDEHEKFDRLQMSLLLENPDSAAFYNAKMRTQRRKTYETAMSQPQPSMMKQSRPPGTPVRSMRIQPPSMLQVQY